MVSFLRKLKELRTWLHVVHGFLPIALIALWHEGAIISIIWCIGFVSYEVLQDREEHDKSYKDMYSFLLGVALAGIGVIIWRIVLFSMG